MTLHFDPDKVLAGMDGFSPFPHCDDRTAWEAVCPDARAAYLSAAEGLLNYDWPALRMDFYLLVGRTGEIRPGWVRFCQRRAALGVLMIAECLEGKGRFLDQVVNGIFSICEETSWIQNLSVKGTLPTEEDNFIDLSSSETAQLFAFCGHLLGSRLDAISGEVRARMAREVYRRVIKPYLERDDYWWMGYTDDRINNWNPWCNANVLFACALMGFPDKRAAVERLTESLGIYIDRYSTDGACDEGPMYWHAAGCKLGICVAWLSHFAGELPDEQVMAKLRLIGAYYYKVHIHGEYFVDYADGDAIVPVPPSAFRFGQFLNDENLTRLGAQATRHEIDPDTWFQTHEHLLGLFDAPKRAIIKSGAPHIREAQFSRCEILVARENEGSPHGFFLSAKGGTNIESHNHNDIGNFIVYLDGEPLLIDLGTEEYTSKTFSPERFDLWYLQSRYHNCPIIGGHSQRDGAAFRARDVSFGESSLSMDIAPAYPAEAGALVWKRSVALRRGTQACVVITDEYRLSEARACSYCFMSARKPEAATGRVCIGPVTELLYDAEALLPEIEEIAITESRLRSNWGERVWRVLLHEKTPQASARREFTIRREGRSPD